MFPSNFLAMEPSYNDYLISIRYIKMICDVVIPSTNLFMEDLITFQQYQAYFDYAPQFLQTHQRIQINNYAINSFNQPQLTKDQIQLYENLKNYNNELNDKFISLTVDFINQVNCEWPLLIKSLDQIQKMYTTYFKNIHTNRILYIRF